MDYMIHQTFEVVIYKKTNAEARCADVMTLQKMNKADFPILQKVEKML